MATARTAQALELMQRFAERTGLTSEAAPERYLWTDAFAVCNWLGLGKQELALRLVRQVHETLGRHRGDDERRGWLCGLEGSLAEAHPTRGGLRIGKKLPERRRNEPYDERLEWERDGQYFHYLTKWMHALDQVARWTKQPLFNVWARELAETAHRAFTYAPAGGADRRRRRMHWKASIDLSRPLVVSMGQHDPLDGWITCVQLAATAAAEGAPAEPDLGTQAADFAAMVEPALETTDPLGLGGLLTDAYRIEQLSRSGALAGSGLRDRLLSAALLGLQQYVRRGDLRQPATHRLAFRELGLAIGVAAVDRMRERTQSPLLDDLAQLSAVRERIESFWLLPEHRACSSWLEHANINDVMLATSLAPSGYLDLGPSGG